jgi:hypothetical protein
MGPLFVGERRKRQALKRERWHQAALRDGIAT